MNSARVSTEMAGVSAVTKETPLEPFRTLLSGKGPRATVSISVGRSIAYGEMKVTANVSLQCDQNEETIDRAGEMAFTKACEFLNEGFGVLEQKMREIP